MTGRVYYIILLITSGLLLLNEGESFAEKTASIKSAQGVIDVSGIDFVQQPYVEISGEWKFFRNQLLTPEKASSNPNYEWLSVPSSWTTLKNMNVFGYGTYSVTILLPQHTKQLTLYLPVISSAARVWVDDCEIVSRGTVSETPSAHQGTIGHFMINLPANGRQTTITIQVSNFSFSWAGIVVQPQLGIYTTIENSIDLDKAWGNLFAGSLIAIAITHLFLFGLYKKEKAYFFLALICLCIAVRSFMLSRGSLLGAELFPTLEGEYLKKLEFLSVYLLIIFFPQYVSSSFNNRCPEIPVAIFTLIGIAFSAAVILTPINVYTSLLDLAHITFLFEFIFAGYVFYMNRFRADTKILLTGILTSFPLIALEMLANSEVIHIKANHFVEFGVLVFFLFQSLLLARKNARAYSLAENLNRKLEVMVKERTQALSHSNKIKDSLLSVLSHDLKSPINSLKGLLHIFNQGAISQDELKVLMNDMEKNVTSTSMMLENMLSWSASQASGLKIQKKKIGLFKLVEDHILMFSLQSSQKNLQLINLVPRHSLAHADENIISLVLRNLISNAIKFSPAKSVIEIFTKIHGNKLLLMVRDHGVGMNEETLHKLFLNQRHTTKGTQNEKGHGLGLSLCKKFLLEMDAEIFVESAVGGGTTFTVVLENYYNKEPALIT